MRNGIFVLATIMCISSVLLYNILIYLFTIKVSSLTLLQAKDIVEVKDKNGWYPPNSTWITDLSEVVDGSGVHGFIFNGSALPEDVQYGEYNFCNMPHVRAAEYQKVSKEFELVYVEVIHRHHKRTPYAHNTFPKESYDWSCSDTALFTYGIPLNPGKEYDAQTYWNITTSQTNAFAPTGFNGSCQFPQITNAGLEDSWQHGKDLFGVYYDLLGFLPNTPDDTILFRVTNNVITSQVAGMVVDAMYPSHTGRFPLQIQPPSIDSLEPSYSCNPASRLYSNYSVGSNDSAWLEHIKQSAPLFKALDSISGVSPTSAEWHQSWDHYFDNLSARQCHSKPLPCNLVQSDACITGQQAEAVYRLGQYEYSFIHRGAPQSLLAATPSYGVYIAELVQNIRDVVHGVSKIKYRHNVAHDGSLSRLLSILQVDVMVWPGMGSEVVFEVFRKRDSSSDAFIRVLWGGRIMRSSVPHIGLLDMVPLETLLGYFESLVGDKAEKVVKLCAVST